MKNSRQWIMVCIVSLCVVAGGCSDDDNVVQRAKEAVTEAEAAAAVEAAGDLLVVFPEKIGNLLDALNADKAATMAQGVGCESLPGIDRPFFCDTALNGEVCPGTGPTDSVWNFSDCRDEDGSVLDGFVNVTDQGGTYDLAFVDFDLDGSRIRGFMQAVTLGTLCKGFTLNNLEIEGTIFTITLDGSKQLCIPGGLSGEIRASVNTNFLRPFDLEIEFVEGQLLPVVLVYDRSTQELLYTCSYSILDGSAECTSESG